MMELIKHFGCPLKFTSTFVFWLFLLFPAISAALGAMICQGSALRIVGASFGAAARDVGFLLLVMFALLEPNNNLWAADYSIILAFLSGSAAAITSCLSPYRGKTLIVMSAIGGFAGQFLMAVILTEPQPALDWIQNWLY